MAGSMGEVGHTQLGEDGRLHTMLADPNELPAVEPAAVTGPQIPSAPRTSKRKSSPLPLILGGLFVVAAIAVPVTIYATGGFDEKEKKPKKTAPAAPAPPPPAPTPTPAPTPAPTPPPQQRPPQQQPQQKPPPQQQPQQQPTSQPSGSSSGKKEPPKLPSVPSNNPLATPWSKH